MTTHPAPDLDALLLGTPFRAVARLEQGGMGEIFEAIGPFGGAPVVVKMLRAELSEQADLVERLLREGEMLRFFTHPNIVVSHGHGKTAAGLPYVVLERLVGTTLRQELIRRGPFPLCEAIETTQQLLSALACVHDAGIVHRDVKPANVMLCEAGGESRVKLIDFGVAKVSGDARRIVTPIAFPTREGLCLGTPRFVSPEQVSGASVDQRSDIYAAGLLLYTLVAGRGPFDDIVGVEHLLAAHLGCEAPPPSRFMKAPLPAPIEAIILRAIAKRPDERYDDARAFEGELSGAWEEARGSLRPSRARRVARPIPYAKRLRADRCRIGAIAAAPRLGGFSDAMIPVTWSETLTRLVAPSPRAETSPKIAMNAAPREEVASKSGHLAAGRAPHENDVTPHTPRRDPALPDEAKPEKSSLFRAPVSRRGVIASSALFFAVAGGVAMWFVR
ncbi:MAG: protein kinase [Polyangiaceae bacterium]